MLFLCTGNAARSQIAEAFLRDSGGDDYEAFSASFQPRELDPLTGKVFFAMGTRLDWSFFREVGGGLTSAPLLSLPTSDGRMCRSQSAYL